MKHKPPRTVKQGADLFTLSNDRASYRDGFEVAEINAEPGAEYLRFANGRTLRLGEETGGLREDVWRVQIKHTVKKHLDKELQVRARGLKVLSLFFVDRVANYRDYGADGQPVKGKFAEVFEEVLADLAKDERYRELAWLKEPVERLHNGYFAADKRKVQGKVVEVLKDTRGDTQSDDEVYNLIMKDKERLLSLDEPLRFIFSHSALREGWDNPNVFQICTLNESRSAIKKRQEIGRGLRLPVDQTGVRVFDESVNKLYVMANESYEDFARALQTEYEEECGVTFGKVPFTAIVKLTRIVDGTEQPIGRDAAESIRAALVEQKMIDADGRIQPAFDPRRKDFTLDLPEAHQDLAPAVVDRTPYPEGQGRGRQQAEKRGHAQPRISGPVEPDQAEDDLSRRVRDRWLSASRGRRHQPDGADRSAKDSRLCRTGASAEGRRNSDCG